MKAHDVRHLCQCAACNALGDDRDMIQADGKNWCGGCAVVNFGIDGICALPRTQRRKFRLGDIGPKAMKALVDLAQTETKA
jgi:hypothetical protein